MVIHNSPVLIPKAGVTCGTLCLNHVHSLRVQGGVLCRWGHIGANIAVFPECAVMYISIPCVVHPWVNVVLRHVTKM